MNNIDYKVGIYIRLSREDEEKEKYYTVQVNDVVIFGEVDDVATTRRELDILLETKYKNNGFLVTAVNEYIHGMAVDNVQIIHA